MFAWRKRIGHICPGSISTSAYDFYLVAPEGVGLFSVTNPIEDWRDDEYERSLAKVEQAAKYLASVHVDFIAHVGVPLVVSQGPEFMRRFLSQVEAQTGLPASTTINSAKEALRSLGAERIIVLTPFPPETHQRVVSFLASEGFAVEAEARMETKFKDLYLIGEREVYDFMTRAVRRGPKVEAVFAPCPQWHAFELTRSLELATGLPFVTGDGCDFWYAFKTLGVTGVKPGYGILLDQLSAVDKPDVVGAK
ncbi:MAG: hypothetical protein A3G24_23235 [Betaproteobacteria bacterium RIFCSPLOWO2_12_FULL_62_13]|nr:MAG: hypothetical protein A3G24_23235 [Betaproteobacteria bacterium RIFCSPLOWO2_12_FULL_62_13]